MTDTPNNENANSPAKAEWISPELTDLGSTDAVMNGSGVFADISTTSAS